MENKKLIDETILSQRVIFNNPKIRKQFFSELKIKFESWKNLRLHFNLYRSRLDSFMCGSRSIPYDQFLQFIKFINKKNKRYYLKKITLKPKNWGRIEGGKTTYKKYPHFFEEGRKKAQKNIKLKIINLNLGLNPRICEVIGTFIGDGFTNKYGSRYIIQFTGDYKLDMEYYLQTISQVIKKTLPESKPGLIRVKNALRYTIYSKGFYNFLTEELGLPPGKKCYTVTIPKRILDSKDYNLINPCIRGIFDTDGCVAFDKRKAYIKPYLRIVLQMESKELIKQIYKLLSDQNIKATITKDNRVIQINGFDNCKEFIKKIGFSNPRHLNKLKGIY